MKKFRSDFTLDSICLLLLLISNVSCGQVKHRNTTSDAVEEFYQYRDPSSSDGTGKYYLGRDIAQVMGHRGASWLERESREEEERTDLLVRALELQYDDVVADIGAGTGYFSFKISPLVPGGKVLAVDIQEEMLDIIRSKMQEQHVSNIDPILGSVKDPSLPKEKVDLVLMVDAYHEFSHPRETMQAIVSSLAPDGRVVLAEYKAEDPSIMIKPRHKMTEDQAVKEMTAVGLYLIENKQLLPKQHLMFFGKQ
ncbi:ubiquinone/menaquinone biosynthesis C-methylase UbiE [Catalinimonas alkaloidigena]|uniref:class I SAM-dependent methyltransferase n=1 Tax=Catalinimonas alkaloidigena TaxID=1075417 RepID=UPI0024053AC7|nr:class I SAM-dependent methyltransferase [Catalinimonas alkaloidigena]MDF9798334.1 ubiquinone/menaquinone biosynthesis C-methylase UbiE [Catalinimonas alkaloidigena]